MGKLKPVELIESTMPNLMDALALGLPCREMCDAVTASCNCGRPTAFGDMIAALERKKKKTAGAVAGKDGDEKRNLPFAFAANVSLVTAMQVFKKIWAKPVCELFVPKVGDSATEWVGFPLAGQVIDYLKIMNEYKVQCTKDHKFKQISIMQRESPMIDGRLTAILMMA